MKMLSGVTASIMLVCLLTGSFACSVSALEAAAESEAVTAEAMVEPEAAASEKQDETDDFSLNAGEELCGFTLEDSWDCSLLNAKIHTFSHKYSGAELVYVENSDPEVAFSISYRTPYVDETDTNHVFEHAIIAGSAKYPAKDVFFDMANKAYHTFVNAHTVPTATIYPVSSMSEDQLLKMMDVYMSCMVDPVILTDERFFEREALRLELEDPEGEISVTGTVFAEDLGFLTDGSQTAREQVLDALYPGEYASNMLGMAHMHYQDLTYENTVATYERCYHFDNSLIFLYGDLDIERFLSFLDEEYLSREAAFGTDLSEYEDPLTPEGRVDVRCEIPAYEGDAVENNGIITYAVDLQSATDEELMKWAVFATALNMVGSPLYNMRIMNNLQSPVSAGVSLDTPKPYFSFTMSYANEDQKEEMETLVSDSLEMIAKDGIDPELLKVIIKSQELSSRLLRDSANVGAGISVNFAAQWARSGDCNYLRTLEEALASLLEDEEQTEIKEMAEILQNPRRSAVVTCIPAPGLAEKIEEERNSWLQEMKESMSSEELEALAEHTKEFNEWNEEEQPNNDFCIDPEELPEPEEVSEYECETEDGITVWKGAADVEGVGSYRLFFDLGGMSREEIEYLMLTKNYLLQMDTAEHSAAELYLLMNQYLGSLGLELFYPPEEAGENHRPMLKVSWKGLTEDFGTGLSLLLELLTETDYSNQQMLTYLTLMSADAWDMSRQDGFGIAQNTAFSGAGLSRDSCAFEMDADGQDVYYLITDISEKLQTEEGFADVYAERLQNAVRKAFTKENLVFMEAAGESELDTIEETAVLLLGLLPEKPADADAVYELPVPAQRSAICIEDSVTNTFMAGSYTDEEDFDGRYIPFIYALNDKYSIPVFRFKLGAYGAQSSHSGVQGVLVTYVYSDPNVKSTINALYAMPDAFETMELTEEELDGYILSAYSTATYPIGVMGKVMSDMTGVFMGGDPEKQRRFDLEMREAAPEDLPAAGEAIRRVIEKSALCTVGNEALIRADADCFDEVVTYREQNTVSER